MRPLPVEPIRATQHGALSAVDGLAMIRGAAVPVVDARKLLGVPAPAATRFVVLRVADRQIALAVDEVLDVRRIEAAALPELPPLLRSAERELVSVIGALDKELLIVLDAARVLPDDSWRVIECGGSP